MLGRWAAACAACRAETEPDSGPAPRGASLHERHEHAFDVELRGSSIPEAEDAVMVLFDRDGTPYARTHGCRYLGTRRVVVGDSILIYRRGYEVALVDVADGVGMRVAVDQPAGSFRIGRIEPATAASRFAFRIKVLLDSPEAAERVLLDDWVMTNDAAAAAIPAPREVVTVVQPQNSNDSFWWPRTFTAIPGAEGVIRVESLRDVRLAVGTAPRPLVDVALGTAWPSKALPEDWTAARVDGLIHFAVMSPPRLARDGGRLVLRQVPACAFHLFVDAHGVGGYALISPDTSESELTLGPLDPAPDPVPLVGGAVPPAGTMLAPGELDIRTLSELFHLQLFRRGNTQELSGTEKWPGLTLPPVGVLSAWHPSSGVAYLRRGQGRLWEGDWEPGSISVVSPRGTVLSGVLSVTALLPGTGGVRVSGVSTIAQYQVDGLAEFTARGLPSGPYSVVARFRGTGELSGSLPEKVVEVAMPAHVTADVPAVRCVIGG